MHLCGFGDELARMNALRHAKLPVQTCYTSMRAASIKHCFEHQSHPDSVLSKLVEFNNNFSYTNSKNHNANDQLLKNDENQELQKLINSVYDNR